MISSEILTNMSPIIFRFSSGLDVWHNIFVTLVLVFPKNNSSIRNIGVTNTQYTLYYVDYLVLFYNIYKIWGFHVVPTIYYNIQMMQH